MRIAGFPAGMFQTNCYLIWDDDPAGDADAVIVDPGQDSAEVVMSQVREQGLRPRAVLLTHGHLDHVWNAREVADHYGIAAHIHPRDRYMLTDPGRGLSLEMRPLLAGMSFTEPRQVTELADGDHLDFGPLGFEVDHAPGHSPGSVVLRTTATDENGPRELVLGGDVLFQDGIGRTDLPGGDTDTLMRSIAETLLPLHDETLVLPGHGPATTIGRERRANPFLRGL